MLKPKGYLISNGYMGKIEDTVYPNGQKKEEYQCFDTEQEYLDYVNEYNKREEHETCKLQK